MEARTEEPDLDKHMRKTFKSMENLWRRGELCDIVLNVGSSEIPAHKIVLASFSPYFHAMFTSDLAESKQKHVTLKDVHPGCLKQLIFFAYTGRIEINEANVQNILPVASLLQVSSVEKICCEFLKQQLHPSNCLGIHFFAELYDGEGKLAFAARRYCLKNYTKMSECEEFMQLTKEQLTDFLRNDELFVKSEDQVLASLLRWLKHDLKSRLHHLPQLMTHIRISYVSHEFLGKITKDDHDTIGNAVTELKASNPANNKPLKKRSPPGQTVIYAVGGYLRTSLDILECYDPSTLQWTVLHPMPEPRSGVGAAYLDGMLYVIGGRNNNSSGNTDSGCVDRYDPLTNAWQSVASLAVARNRLGVGTLRGHIYAVGGGDGSSCHKTVECYNPKEERWRMIKPMNTPRIGAGVAVLNDRLYAAGGYDGERRLRSVECYNPESNFWTFVSALQTHRSGAGMIAMGQYLYAVGGYNGQLQLNSVEQYDPALDAWTLIANMQHHRSALGLAVLRDRLYAIGGYSGEGFVSSVEVYDPMQDTWQESGSNLSTGRSGVGVCVGWIPTL